MAVMLQGFLLAFSLILAIGAQNAFVLRAGLRNQHVFVICSFCAISDIILITLGINGMAVILAPLAEHMIWIYLAAALWLISYGVLRWRDARSGQSALNADESAAKGFWPSMMVLAGVTWLNPHVYLDTVVLVGSVSSTVADADKIYFAIGAYAASLVFFFSLGFGAKAFGKTLTSPKIWARIDYSIAILMFWIAGGLIWAGFTV